MANISAVTFINRYYNKVIFSDAPNLNVGVRDMGDEQCTATFEDDAVKRLKAATGTVASLQMFIPAQLTLTIKKTSPVANYYGERFFANGYIGGSLTLYDDTNKSYTALDPSIRNINLGQLNGTSPTFEVIIDANLEVNKQALSGF